MQAARELKYRPNVLAQALAGGKTQMIGVLVSNLRYPFVFNIVSGIEDRLTEKEYITILASTHGDDERTNRLLGQLRRRGVDGFILVPGNVMLTQSVEKTLKSLQQDGIPIVVASSKVNLYEIDRVSYRSQTATKEIIDYLVNLGHQRIGFVGGRHSEGLFVSRWLGYQEGLLVNRLPLNLDLVKETDVTAASCKEATLQLLSLPNPPSAIFAMNDVVATGVLDACYQAGKRIPEDISVMSFDYLTKIQRRTPALTSVVIPTFEIGQKSAQLLVNRLHNPALPPQHVTIEYQIAERETTAVFRPEQ